MARRQSHLADRIKRRMQLLQLPRFAQRRSISTAQQSLKALAVSNGQRVFNDGTNAQSSMERTTPLPCVRSQKHGEKCSATSAPLSCWRSFLTKTCAVSAK